MNRKVPRVRIPLSPPRKRTHSCESFFLVHSAISLHFVSLLRSFVRKMLRAFLTAHRSTVRTTTASKLACRAFKSRRNRPKKKGQFTDLFSLVHSARFERTTFGSASRHSIQLSYECILLNSTYPTTNQRWRQVLETKTGKKMVDCILLDFVHRQTCGKHIDKVFTNFFGEVHRLTELEPLAGQQYHRVEAIV